MRASSIAFIVIPILLMAAIFLAYFSLTADFCNNDVISESIAPDGQAKAVAFMPNCGARTSESMQVSIIGSHETLPNEGGNVSIEDRGHNPRVSLSVVVQ